jgi:hypothetical protein
MLEDQIKKITGQKELCIQCINNLDVLKKNFTLSRNRMNKEIEQNETLTLSLFEMRHKVTSLTA